MREFVQLFFDHCFVKLCGRLISRKARLRKDRVIPGNLNFVCFPVNNWAQ